MPEDNINPRNNRDSAEASPTGQKPENQQSYEEQVDKILGQADEFIKVGDNQSAEQCFIKLIELNPKDVVSYYVFAGFYEQLNRTDEARALYEKALKLAPDDTLTYGRRARFYERIGKIDEALADYNKIISLSPNHIYSYADLASFFERIHQPDNALFNYDRAIKVTMPFGPFLSLAYSFRAGFYERRGKMDEAISDYTKSIEANPKDVRLYLTRSEFYQRQLIPEKLELALKDAQMAIDINPDKLTSYFQKGLVLLDLHRYSEASRAFEDALNSKDDKKLKSLFHHSIEFYLAWSTGLSAYYQGDDFNQAMSYFLEAKRCLENLSPVFMRSYNTFYISGLLDSYLQLIPMDNKLKDVLSEPDKLPQRTEALDGLRESFSGMFKLSNELLVEIDMLLETKRDICALLLPLDHLHSVKPADTADLLERIEGDMRFLKYEHTDELMRILKENRQKLETNKPFTAELTKAGNMADGWMTFGTAGSTVSEKLGNLIRVPEEEEVEMSIDPVTKELIPSKIRRKYRYITRESREYRTLSGLEQKPITPAKVNLVDVRELIMQKRKNAGLIIPPQAHEILMQFVQRNTQVKIETFIKEQLQEIGTYIHSQLDGFQHIQGDVPLMAWKLLVTFALTGPEGHPPPEGETKTENRKSHDKFRKQVSDLNDKLKRLLGITDNAIIFDKQTGNYKPIIQLQSSRRTIE